MLRTYSAKSSDRNERSTPFLERANLNCDARFRRAHAHPTPQHLVHIVGFPKNNGGKRIDAEHRKYRERDAWSAHVFKREVDRKMNEQLMTVDHFGSGGRRSDPRLGRRGEKLGDCGIVGLWDCGEIAISEISGFFMFFLI